MTYRWKALKVCFPTQLESLHYHLYIKSYDPNSAHDLIFIFFPLTLCFILAQICSKEMHCNPRGIGDIDVVMMMSSSHLDN